MRKHRTIAASALMAALLTVGVAVRGYAIDASPGVESAGVRIVPRNAPALQASYSGPSIQLTSVTVGYADPAHVVPCYNCVSNAKATSVGISVPLAAIPARSSVTEVVQLDDVTYNGSCSITIILKHGTTVLHSVTLSGTCKAGNVMYAQSTYKLPSAVQSATAEGKLKAGAVTQTMSVPIYIE